ncbi:hypothetical protein B0T09DRAFT_353961 [Sordaria sp. MPI-SDFR-AT-0083]|nr:hypothetical protein B0T09DRAFT_353961 [Sordaria sp. MPI-SDFR-AT-0083]
MGGGRRPANEVRLKIGCGTYGKLSPHVKSLLNLLELEDIDKRLIPHFIRVFSYAGKYNIKTGRFERARILMYYHKDHPFQNKIADATTRLYTRLLGILMDAANNIAALKSYSLSIQKTFQNLANLTCEEEKTLSLYDELKALGPEVFNDNASRIVHFTLNAPPFTSDMLLFLGIVTKVFGFDDRCAEQEAIYRAFVARRTRFPDEEEQKHSSGSQNTLWLFIYEAMAGQGKDREITDLLGPRRTTLNLEGFNIFNQVEGYDSLKELGSRHPNALKVRGRIATILARRDKHMEAAILQRRHENGHVPQAFFHVVITYGAILEHQGKTTQSNEFLMNHWKVRYVDGFEAWARDRFDVADEREETSSDEDEPYDENGDSDMEESDIEGSESVVVGSVPPPFT